MVAILPFKRSGLLISESKAKEPGPLTEDGNKALGGQLDSLYQHLHHPMQRPNCRMGVLHTVSSNEV